MRIARLSSAALLLGLLVLTSACARRGAPGVTATSGPDATYAQVQRVFDAKCTTCHAGPDAAAGLRLDAWAGLMEGSEHGEVVIPFDAERSLLLDLATELEGGPHPQQGGEPLSEAEVALVTEWVESGARSPEGTVPYADADNLLYATNQGSALVSVIDMDANVVIRTVDLQALGFSANAKPHHTAVDPDGEHWYVSLIGESKVLKFNRANELVGQVDFEVPGMLVVSPTDDRLFVGRSMSAVNPPQRIGVIDRSAMTADQIEVFFPRPHALAVTPNGETVYSASLAENRIAAVDVESEEAELIAIESAMESGAHHHMLVQFAVTPDGERMIAGGQMSGQLLVFDLSDPYAPALIDMVEVPGEPWHPVISPDGRTAYFGNKGANAVTVFDLTTNTVADVIEHPALAQPHGSALSPDGRTLYISSTNVRGDYTPRYDLASNDEAGAIVVIDTATREVVKVLEVETNPTGLGN